MNRHRETTAPRYFDTRAEAEAHLNNLHKSGKTHARMIQTRNTMGNIVYKVIA